MVAIARIYTEDLSWDEISKLLASAAVELKTRAPGYQRLEARFVGKSARRNYPEEDTALEILPIAPGGALTAGMGDFIAEGSEIAAASYILSRCLGMRSPLLTTDPATYAAVCTAICTAAQPVSVLVVGETGTGKDLMVGLINAAGSGGPLISLNCAGLDRQLLSAELFGGGNADGWSHRAGGVALATGGTLFLDRVNELPTTGQRLLAALLRDSSTGSSVAAADPCSQVHYVASITYAADVAQNYDLDGELEREFATPALVLPPLRQRPADIPIISREFLAQRHPSVRLSDAAAAALGNYAFPGNVRELGNLLTRLVLGVHNEFPGTIDVRDVETALDAQEAHPQEFRG